MKPLLMLLVAGFAVSAAGCSSPSTRWVKAGTTPEDFQLDQDQCAARSQNYDFAFDDRDSGRLGDGDSRLSRAGSVRGDVYRDCMQARGWQRERGGQAPR